MKSKIILVGIIIAIIVGVVIVVVFNHNSSSFILDNKEDGSISVTAKNASKNSGGVGEVTIQEGQKLEVKTNLEEKSSINVKVKSSSQNYNEEAVLDENFKENEEREFDIPSGNYNIFITAEKGATGDMNINVK